MENEKKRILVVDDSQDVRDLLIHILLADNHHVYSAVNGSNALAILRANPMDLVLLDIMMPDKSGLDVLREIRSGSLKKNLEVPVVMVTAKSSTEDIDTALALGANSYIVKPFRGISVREKVRAVLGAT